MSKYCPLIKDYCHEAGCAWWHKVKQCCAIVSITDIIDDAQTHN